MPDQAVIQSFLVPVRGNVAEPFGARPDDVGFDLRQGLAGNALQCFAESDQEALNCELALAVGADFGVVSDEFLCFAARLIPLAFRL